jgi:hypothetical protein
LISFGAKANQISGLPFYQPLQLPEYPKKKAAQSEPLL